MSNLHGTWDIVELAYIDTGLEGCLMIPEAMAQEILASRGQTLLRLADGALVRAPSWQGQLNLDDRRFSVEVVALGSQFLLGRDILDQMEVCFLFGKEVRIRF